jgi:hypothetical protein
MFSLSLIEHDLPMPPHLLNRPLADAIKAELERLFLDKVKWICFYLAVESSLFSNNRLSPFTPMLVIPKGVYLFAFGV